MFKKIFLMMGLLAAVSSYADVHVVARIEITENSETQVVPYDKILPDDGSETYVGDSGLSLVGTITNVTESEVELSFEVRDEEGTVISRPYFKCVWEEEASVRVTANYLENDEIAFELVLFVTVLRN